MHRVLFVCAANVCRSPYLATALSAKWEHDDDDALLVSSRGVDVRARRPMCSLALHRLRGHGYVDDGEDHHVSRPLTLRDVARNDLILTAGVDERSAVARIDPSARSRTFTVREAVQLAQEIGGVDDVLTDGRSLSAYAAVLDARRGTLPLQAPDTRRRPFWARRPVEESPLDIPDSHNESKAAHHRLFTELDRHADAIAALVRSRVGSV